MWPLYNVEHIRYGIPKAHPGSMRRHVFDFKTGIRMIITREHAPLAEDPEKRGPFLVVGAKIQEGRAQMNGSQIPIGEIVRAFMYMSRAPKEIEPLSSNISENGVLRIIWEAPFKGQYAPDIPIPVIKKHERHRELEVYGEEKTIGHDAFDPRLHCSICSERDSKSSEKGEQT